MATLTSTGAVNLTSSTNWSPAQIPVAGDDLVIGAHTLTLDANLVLNSVTFNSSSSRMVIAGATRTVQATNGWTIALNNSIGELVTTALDGQTVTLYGRWWLRGNNAGGHLFRSVINGSILTFATVGNDPSAELLLAQGQRPSFILGGSLDAKLITVGRLTITGGEGIPFNPNSYFGEWQHTSIGINTFSNFYMPNIRGKITFYGDATYSTNSYGSPLWSLSSGNNSNNMFVGNHKIINNTVAAFAIFGVSGAANSSITLIGNASATHNGTVTTVSSGTFNWSNQSATVPIGERCLITASGGSVNLTNLQLNVEGHFAFVSTLQLPHVTTGASIYVSPGGSASAINNALASQIIATPSPAPVFPPTETVLKDEVYGYAGAELVGTAMLIDPAIISSAVLAAQLATLQRNPALVIERTLEDDKPLTFSWPNSTDTIQGQVSIDNGAYVSVTGTISYFRSENGKYYYTLAYDPADRPSEEGTARYRFYSGSHNIYATLRVVKPSPVLGEIREGLALEATSQTIKAGVTSLNNNDRGEFF